VCALRKDLFTSRFAGTPSENRSLDAFSFFFLYCWFDVLFWYFVMVFLAEFFWIRDFLLFAFSSLFELHVSVPLFFFLGAISGAQIPPLHHCRERVCVSLPLCIAGLNPRSDRIRRCQRRCGMVPLRGGATKASHCLTDGSVLGEFEKSVRRGPRSEPYRRQNLGSGRGRGCKKTLPSRRV